MIANLCLTCHVTWHTSPLTIALSTWKKSWVGESRSTKWLNTITCKSIQTLNLNFNIKMNTAFYCYYMYSSVLKETMIGGGGNITKTHAEDVSLCALFLMDASKRWTVNSRLNSQQLTQSKTLTGTSIG